MFSGQLSPYLDSRLVNIHLCYLAVRSGKVDVFENTESPSFLTWKGIHTPHPLFVNNHECTPGAHHEKFCLDEIKGAGFTGQNPLAIHFPEAQGTKSMRVAYSYHVVLGEHYQRIGSLNTSYGIQKGVGIGRQIGTSQQMKDYLAVNSGLKDFSTSPKLLPVSLWPHRRG